MTATTAAEATALAAMTSADGAPPTVTVAVRALCEFTARVGDLDLRFTPSPTSQQGIEGHQLVASRRGAGYEPERALEGRVGHVLVRGRADGWDPARQRLEEVKTHKGQVDAIPANHRGLHRAQLLCYGALICAELGLAEVELALVYLDVATQRETVFAERLDRAALQAHLETQVARYAAWAAQEAAHRDARDVALAALAFPHASFRDGQRTLAEAVYRGAAQGRCILAQAPTGIGKTVGTLFPLLKAMPAHGLDRVFFVSAKSSGRALALDAVRTLAGARSMDVTDTHPGIDPSTRRPFPLPLRTLELVARDKACEHPDKACHGESCPLARGFYDRLPAARAAAVQAPMLDRETLRAVAAEHAVCPYYLGQELAHWCDVAVGDYNYWFDAHAMLFALAQVRGWRVGLLVDEAHNLLERGRRMYSATLSQSALKAARAAPPAPLKRPLDRLHREWNALNKEQPGAYAVQPALPAAWLDALVRASHAIGEHLAEHPTLVDPPLLDFHLEALQFTRLAESFDRHSLCDVEQDLARPRGGSTVSLRNVVPAPFLGPRFAAARTVTLFSATLQPAAFHRTLLGLPESTVEMDVPSPFRAEQLRVHVARELSTRYRDRAASMPPLVDRIARQYAARPGNYLAFFSSHDYLREAADRFEATHPDVPVWRQARRMSEPEQHAFLERLVPGGRAIAFAVLGGSFAEGIDLPGDRLIGAFVATLGLPQVNPINEEMRRRLDALFGTGYDFAYLYPGLQKVVQAAGRVIRSTTDEGVVHLLDERFARREIQALLPTWWRIEGK
jgi:Rad3-related DNA helicase